MKQNFSWVFWCAVVGGITTHGFVTTRSWSPSSRRLRVLSLTPDSLPDPANSLATPLVHMASLVGGGGAGGGDPSLNEASDYVTPPPVVPPPPPAALTEASSSLEAVTAASLSSASSSLEETATEEASTSSSPLEYAVEQSRTSPLPFWEQPSVLAGRLMALTAAAMYGTNFASIKLLNDSLPVSLAGSLRFGMGALGFGLFVLWAERQRDRDNAGQPYFQVYESRDQVIPVSKAELHKERTDAMWAGAEVGLWYAVGCIAQAVALLEVDASKSAFFNAAAILVVPLLDLVFKGKNLGLAGMTSITLAMGGMGLLQFGDAGTPGAMAFTVSDVLCVLQAVFMGVGYWRLENGTTKFPAQAQRITLGILLGLASGAFTYSLAMGIVPPPEAIFLTLFHFPMITASLAWTGLGGCAGAMYLETISLKAISATELTILLTSVSLFGAAFAYVTMGETMTPTGMAGGALLLAGCVISSLMGEKEPEPEASFVLGEEDASILVSEATDYESIEEAVANSADWNEQGTTLSADGISS